jgi:hypothetical protein
VIDSQAANKGTHAEEDIGLSVHHRGAGLAIPYANTLKDITSILALVQEEPVVSLLH